ncbi:MAG TPA: serine/threonine-protein kinase [Gemmatirosa sp.]
MPPALPSARDPSRTAPAHDDEPAWIASVFAPGALGATYQFVRVVGRGGMGIVVLARERALHRAAAIKLLHPALAASPRAVERFRREARIQAQLEHPGIVPLYACGETQPGDGRGPVPYLAMRYVAGESLAEQLARRAAAGEPAAPVADVRDLLGQLAAALAFAHGQGVVHRDLKPENVLVERGTRRVLLTDFGVAALPSHDDPRVADHSAGTPRWMAPEQVAGEHAVDGRTDVYALGMLGIALLTGRRPFPTVATAAVPAAHVTAAVPDVAALAPGTPGDLCRTLARCLAKDPAERWPSAAAFGAAVAGPATSWRRWFGAFGARRAAEHLAR